MKAIIYKKIIPLLLLSLSFFICGCFGVDGNFKKTRNEVFRALNAEGIDREFEYSASNFEIYLASKIAGLSGGLLEAEMLLEKISNVQIGVYNVEENESLSPDSFFPLEDRMKNKGWTKLVKSCNHNDRCYVYVNLENKDIIKEVFVLYVDSEQLVMVEIHGKLEKLIEMIIKNRGIKA